MLTPLATQDDLDDRNIVVPDDLNGDVLLATAADAVRDAAGCAITQETSTVTLVVDDYRSSFDLPAGPVTAVASITVNAVVVTGWRKVGDTIYMPTTWQPDCLPVEVTVTYTHGLPIVPTDIVDLVCGMVSIASAQDGSYGGSALTHQIKLGDYAETAINPPGTESPSPFALPDSVRERLRVRFGASAAVVKVR
jgi:hypothetical protein